MQEKLIKLIAEEENILVKKVKATVELLDKGNTIPFIARYRKENTGGLNEEEIRNIKSKIDYLRNLEERKDEVLRLIDDQDKLTEDLAQKIKKARVLQEVEDLYRPYKKKRKTRATKARKKGLKPLAKKMWKQEIKQGDLIDIGKTYINEEKDLTSIEAVFQGARDIIAEWISDDAEIRKKIRKLTFEKGFIKSEVKDENKDENNKYKMYYEYREPISKIPPHRILALNRGEDEDILRIKVDIASDKVYSIIRNRVIKEDSLFYDHIINAINDAYKRLIGPSIAREVRNKLTEKAESHAIEVFGSNLRSLLLQSPLKGHTVMGIDPGYRTGSKVCVIDKRGEVLVTETIYPHPPQKEKDKSGEVILKLVAKYQVDAIAIGNGTASRDTELFISELLENRNNLKYVIVDEAGASVYSASKIGREEFPEMDVAMRGAVSIARRLQDPLAELVKIDPAHIGVGLYQHDIDSKRLKKSLQKVVESVVNYVGVDLNTASSHLLEYVSGIKSNVAQSIIDHRKEIEGFSTRKELKKVYGLGPKTFTQAAGFLRIYSVEDPLARTPIHPESYTQTEELITRIGYQLKDILDDEKLHELRNYLREININKLAEELDIGIPTLKDIIKALKEPGRDPREDLNKPIFRTDVLQMDDLEPEMILKGKVKNVVDFGAFVDIGIKEDGLVHISEMSYEYVEDPLEVVEVGETVKVKILNVDTERKRVSLSMKV